MSDTYAMMSKADKDSGAALSPLNSIRVFVEAARALNFSRAATALGMTQSGVSHHIGVLERYLGRRLFDRKGASLSLTDAGRQYFEAVREAMASVELSTRQLRANAPGCRLVVRTSLPTVAMTVLIPALPRFVQHPPVSVDLLTSLSPPAPEDVFDVLLTRDLALPDEAHWQLAQETLVCVAAPSVHARCAASGIAEWSFISAKSRPEVLVDWVHAQGLDASLIRVGAAFEHYYLAVSAAIGGMGYLVAPRLLVADALRQGQLCDAGMPPVRGLAHYSAWVNPRSHQPEVARAFCRWLVGIFREEGAA